MLPMPSSPECPLDMLTTCCHAAASTPHVKPSFSTLQHMHPHTPNHLFRASSAARPRCPDCCAGFQDRFAPAGHREQSAKPCVETSGNKGASVKVHHMQELYACHHAATRAEHPLEQKLVREPQCMNSCRHSSTPRTVWTSSSHTPSTTCIAVLCLPASAAVTALLQSGPTATAASHGACRHACRHDAVSPAGPS